MNKQLPGRKKTKSKRNTEKERKSTKVHRTAIARLERALTGPVIGSPQFGHALVRRCEEPDVSPNAIDRSTSPRKLASAIKVMLDRPFAPHTVQTLATAAGMSRSSFAKQFRDSVGQAPIEFLKYERLRYAAHLLRTTDLPVKKIVGMIGYVSSSYFSRAFQSAFDLPPSMVRRDVRVVPKPSDD